MPLIRSVFFVIAWAWVILIGGLLIAPIGPVCIACGAEASKTSNPVEMAAGIVTIAFGVLGLAAMVALNPQPLPPRETGNQFR